MLKKKMIYISANTMIVELEFIVILLIKQLSLL